MKLRAEAYQNAKLGKLGPLLLGVIAYCKLQQGLQKASNHRSEDWYSSYNNCYLGRSGIRETSVGESLRSVNNILVIIVIQHMLSNNRIL